MILIAPDKYRGTLTAEEAAAIIAEAVGDECIILPMADGGEGTAQCLTAGKPGWSEIAEGAFANKTTGEAAADSAALVGYTPEMTATPPLERSSAPLGLFVNSLFAGKLTDFPIRKLYIGIGGTAVCDGGRGFLEALDPSAPWKERLVSLADVRASLLPEGEEISALTFCPQKGYGPADMEAVTQNLRKVVEIYGEPRSDYAGAGGGLGYAMADALGCPCAAGAQFLLDRADIPWDEVEMVITGEGKFDRQTGTGKAAATLHREASARGIPTLCLAGCVEPGVAAPDGMRLIDLSSFLPGLPLSPSTAAFRLREALPQLFPPREGISRI